MYKNIVFSFCIYGNNIKYLRGLEENLKIINEKLPEFYSYIYFSNDVQELYYEIYSKYKNVKIHKIDKNGPELMLYRILTLDIDDKVDVSFSRDIDSRINDRDIWTINEFLNSNKYFHIIRDHYYHKNTIMGGSFGMKRKEFFSISKELESWKESNKITKYDYGTDEQFLRERVYDMIKNDVLIHSNIVGYLHEKISPIEPPLKNEYDFIGNVVDYDEQNLEYFKFKYYDFPYDTHFYFLRKQEQWNILIVLYEEKFSMSSFTDDMLYSLYMAYYYSKKYRKCIDILRKIKVVSEHLIHNSNYLFSKLYSDIIATTDLSREPKENEIVVYYGNYHYSIDNFPVNNKVYRHPIFFSSLQHTKFEFDDCWDNIDIIYILNLEIRYDRYLEILVELCKLNAPLNKIHHYKAKKVINNNDVNIYYEAAKNHIDVITHFIEHNYNNCLILEDDVTFTNRTVEHKKDLKTFFDRNYDFDVCFITASEYGIILPNDDLLSISKQFCTTSSGYILNKKSSKKILDTLIEGNELLLKTGNHRKYANDRYWEKLQIDNKFFIFNRKFGYQRPSYSNINNRYLCHFD